MPVLHADLCDKARDFNLYIPFSEIIIILRAINNFMILWALLGGGKAPYNLDVLRVYS
jgi:hypothetical protein